jgi:hypothetical protein
MHSKFVEKPEIKKPLGRPGYRLDSNTRKNANALLDGSSMLIQK